jgi:hypothetical protein
MPLMPEVILSLLAHFAHVFTNPTWRNAQVLLIGAILCNGKRTVSSALRVMGLSSESNFSKYHRVLNGSKWDSWRMAKILLGLLLRFIPRGAPILIAMDETLERRKGKKIVAKGCYRDACRSTKSLVIKCFGLKWQCAALLVKLPWSKRCWALPFMTVLCVAKTYDSVDNGYVVVIMSKKSSKLGLGVLGYYKGKFYYENAGVNVLLDAKLTKKLAVGLNPNDRQNRKLKSIKQNIHKLGKKDMSLLTSCTGIRKIKHRTSVDYALLMMVKISRHLSRPWILVADGGFTCVRLAHACVRRQVTLISRLRLDAVLYEFVAEGEQKSRGRRRLKGNKATSLTELVKDSNLSWKEQEVVWYGGIKKTVKLFSGTNLWYKTGFKPLALRWVLVQDPETGRTEAFFSTDLTLSAAKVVEYFVLRWNIEVTFEEARAHLGVETQRQWSENAINQTTPVLFGLFSLVCLMGLKLAQTSNIPVLISAWYDKKRQATFSDVLSFVKQAIVKEKYLNTSASNDDIVQIPWGEFKDLINCGVIAA